MIRSQAIGTEFFALRTAVECVDYHEEKERKKKYMYERAILSIWNRCVLPYFLCISAQLSV